MSLRWAVFIPHQYLFVLLMHCYITLLVFSYFSFFPVFVRFAHGKEEDARVWIATTSTVGVLLEVSATDDGMGGEGYEGTGNDGMKGLGKLCVQWGVFF